ncbi:hypothetical protein, partial [Streptomyces sp. 8K308]|uniref:hypothetical protein n=1 Tax=Streptomyces sp. 8K308 TaxID=2530388 RepID=UPI0014054DC7
PEPRYGECGPGDVTPTTQMWHGRADQAEAALAQFHKGDEPPTDATVADTPATFIWRWNRATPQERHDLAARVLDAGKRSVACFIGDHDKQIANLRQRVDQAEGALQRVRTELDALGGETGYLSHVARTGHTQATDRIRAALDDADTPQ